ncbi:MAG: hypothetical protein SPI34_03840 [Opitutales bacterium]|nr:hypothetical protein [Opitutales bacterium]
MKITEHIMPQRITVLCIRAKTLFKSTTHQKTIPNATESTIIIDIELAPYFAEVAYSFSLYTVLIAPSNAINAQKPALLGISRKNKKGKYIMPTPMPLSPYIRCQFSLKCWLISIVRALKNAKIMANKKPLHNI